MTETVSWWVVMLATFVGLGGGVIVGRYDRQAKWKDAFEEAERIRIRRELHDSGRSYPPRPDAGPPARVHRARVKRVGRKP